MLTRYLLLLSVLFVTVACSSTDEPPLTDSVPAIEREAITTDGSLEGANGATHETLGVYSEDMAGAKPTQTFLEKTIGDRVLFGYDSYSLTSEARAVLLAQAKWLQRFPSLNITVEGHCDERGTREYNLALGERRANSAKNYLVALGIAPSRVNTISYGKERPVAAGSNEAAWAKKRRAVTTIQ